jgi:hypothetical protein
MAHALVAANKPERKESARGLQPRRRTRTAHFVAATIGQLVRLILRPTTPQMNNLNVARSGTPGKDAYDARKGILYLPIGAPQASWDN